MLEYSLFLSFNVSYLHHKGTFELTYTYIKDVKDCTRLDEFCKDIIIHQDFIDFIFFSETQYLLDK